MLSNHDTEMFDKLIKLNFKGLYQDGGKPNKLKHNCLNGPFISFSFLLRWCLIYFGLEKLLDFREWFSFGLWDTDPCEEGGKQGHQSVEQKSSVQAQNAPRTRLWLSR